MKFTAHGHPNILATHKTTFEFTKEERLNKEGDCIIGVGAYFDTEKLKELARKNVLVRITITSGDVTEIVHARTNPDFIDDKELVVRLGEHASPRTFAIRADKAAKHLNRELVKHLQHGEKIEVQIEEAAQQGGH